MSLLALDRRCFKRNNKRLIKSARYTGILFTYLFHTFGKNASTASTKYYTNDSSELSLGKGGALENVFGVINFFLVFRLIKFIAKVQILTRITKV